MLTSAEIEEFIRRDAERKGWEDYRRSVIKRLDAGEEQDLTCKHQLEATSTASKGSTQWKAVATKFLQHVLGQYPEQAGPFGSHFTDLQGSEKADDSVKREVVVKPRV